MTTPEQLIAMAERLERPRNLDNEVLRFEAAALLRRLAGEMDNEFICGRCGKRFDAPQTQEVTW